MLFVGEPYRGEIYLDVCICEEGKGEENMFH